MSIYDSILTIKGIGVKKAQAFEKLGVKTIYDLFCFFPRKYEDRTTFTHIGDVTNGEIVCIRAIIASTPTAVRIKKGMELVKFKIADETGIANITFFNQNYVKNLFEKGETFSFYGKVEVNGRSISITNPDFEKEDSNVKKTGIIRPIYRLAHGITQNDVIKSIKLVFDLYLNEIEDYIPAEIAKKENLCSSLYAYKNIHNPSSFVELEKARNKLMFDELFILSLSLLRSKSEKVSKNGIVMSIPDMSPFFSSLSFSPTDAQHKAIADCIGDMISGAPMNRLIQGDVGSGKTLIASALFYLVFRNGYCSAMMAPTEILATQHYNNLQKILCPLGMRLALLTGSTKNRNNLIKDLSDGKIDLLIGTHALFSNDVEYSNLALIVTDEQHRFGVDHRAKLISKASAPHVCVMSATPIPRTLSLIIYGDLDISIINELPPGRQSVETYLVNEAYRKRLTGFIQKNCAEGRQVYIVCPKIEDDDESISNLKSAEQHCSELKKILPTLNIECIHGKMKPNEKSKIMSDFSYGKINVLVSTTVIEVGVDVPNATLIIIENAERFGLSQLHQLRGRVGRGTDKSYCILVSDTENEDTKNRLNILCKTNDGFKISEEDLRLRGPGDFFGNRQHGLPQMRLAQLGTDSSIISKVQTYSKQLLQDDPELNNHITLKEKCDEILKSKVLFN